MCNTKSLTLKNMPLHRRHPVQLPELNLCLPRHTQEQVVCVCGVLCLTTIQNQQIYLKHLLMSHCLRS